MNGNEWWVLGWGTVTVLAGTGIVLAVPREERWGTARAYFGTCLGMWAAFGTAVFLGWWPR